MTLIFEKPDDIVFFIFMALAFFDFSRTSAEYGRRSNLTEVRDERESPKSNGRGTCRTINASASASSSSSPACDWYAEGSKMVPGSPPPLVFPIVWNVLYAMIFTSTFLFYRDLKDASYLNTDVDVLVVCLIFNLILNKAWYSVFFVLKQIALGAAVIAGMLITGIAILVMFYRLDQNHNRWASFSLFLIYQLWTAYAFYLNLAWIRVSVTNLR